MRVVLITGGRDFTERDYLEMTLDRTHLLSPIDMIIEGGASGADEFAKTWAVERRVHCATVPALWDAFGKSAGYRRNSAMLLLRPTEVIAFPGGKGTQMMIDLAERAGIPVTKVKCI